MRKEFYRCKSVFLLLIIYCGFCILNFFLPKATVSEKEKRVLTAFPALRISSVSDGDFAENIEKYLNDHILLRNFFVSANAYFQLAMGNNGSNGVYLGQNGWLFEKPFAKENHFCKNLNRILSFAEENKINTTVMIVPVKGFVYGEYLPKNAEKYLDGDFLDKLQVLKEHNIGVVDVRSAFKAHKDRTQLYYKTDHHWTSEGAYLAYQTAGQILGYTPLKPTAFTVEKTKDFFGTSHSGSCYFLTNPDTLTIMRNRRTKGIATVTFEDGAESEIHSNLFFTENLAGYDKYTVFLGNNHGFTRIKTGNQGEKLLIIKDSFAHCLVPFLAEHYSEIIMIDLRYYAKPVSDVIQSEDMKNILYVFESETFAKSRDFILR